MILDNILLCPLLFLMPDSPRNEACGAHFGTWKDLGVGVALQVLLHIIISDDSGISEACEDKRRESCRH